jgi:hypothetical protein
MSNAAPGPRQVVHGPMICRRGWVGDMATARCLKDMTLCADARHGYSLRRARRAGESAAMDTRRAR